MTTITHTTSMHTITKYRLWIVSLSLITVLSACGRTPTGGQDHDDHSGEAALDYTDFTGQTELFVEFAPLVVGQASVFAAHVTRLADFQPLTEGMLDVVLTRDEKTVARFRVKEPARTGIFTPEVVPREAGVFELMITVESGDLRAVHRLGMVEVFADAASATAPETSDDGEVTYLKEQQWTSPFALTSADERLIRPSVPGTATVYAGDSAEVSGLMGYLKPVPAGDEDYGQALVALEKARSAAELAQQEVQRLQSLFEAGAIPERRLIEARQTREVADVAFKVAKARLQQHAQSPLTKSQAEGKRWLHIRVPEYVAGRLQDVSGAWFQHNGAIQVLDVGHGARVVKIGGAVDPVSRTVPVVLEYPADKGPTLIGASLTAHVYTQSAKPRLAVPASAVIDDGGRTVVYVQTSGESFTRRAVELGIQDGSWVEVLNGVQAGERVVSTGAYDVKLAAAGGEEIGHGHAH